MKHYLEALAETIRAHWGDPALADYHGRTITYGELAVSMEKTRLALRAAGVRRGDKVALCARNCAAWAETYLGIVSSGAVVVPILSNFTPEGVQHLVDHSESRVLFTDSDLAATLDFSETPRVRAAVSIDDGAVLHGRDRSASRAFAERDALFAEAHPGGFGPKDVSHPTDNDKDLAVINYTSGTTSAPKGVMLCHEAFSVVVDFAQRRIPAHPGESIVSMLPMAHMYGLAFEFLYPLISGVRVVYLVKVPSPTALVAAMKEVRPYIVITVPMVMEKIYRGSLKPALSKPVVRALMALPFVGRLLRRKIAAKVLAAFGGQVREFVMGGAPLNPEAEAAFRKIGLPYTVGYGMTEACPLLAYEDWWKFAPGSCGKPVDYDEVRIDSPDPQHIDGEVQAKGPNLCVGYYRNAEATKALFTKDGFLRTGDLGHFDKAGNLYLSGRSKNMILSASGQNVYPEEIEAVVNQQDFVAESVVVDRGGKLVARVYFDPDAIRKARLDAAAVAALPDRVRTAVNRRMPAYSRLSAVESNPSPFEKTPKMSIKRFLYR
ncbi:MAG: AMP-binding protein [Kiritimatiellae bacterium]|nr:AMP-binding protein [Kiritimatiellia bacterium]